MTTKGFKQRVTIASLWVISANILTQFIRFGSNLITTRLLLPEAFGLVAIAQAIIMGLHFFSDIGLNQSLIRSSSFDPKFINTIWTVRFLQGVAVWLVSILGACFVYILAQNSFFASDSVYADTRLPLIIVVSGFVSVISGFQSTNMLLALRSLNFKKNVLIELLSQAVALFVMITVAYIYHSVWALILGQIVATITLVYLSYAFFEGNRNYFTMDKTQLKEIIHFGKWIFLCSIAAYLFIASDKLILGVLIDKTLLGQYAIATLLIGAIKGLISTPISKLGLPALSEAFRERPESLKSVFYKLRFPIDAISMILAGFLFLSAETIVSILYNDRYQSVGWMLSVFAIGLIEFRYKLNGECYMAMGKPKLTTMLIFFDLVVLYIGMYLLYHFFGFVGLVWIVACTSLSTIPLNLYFMKKNNLLDWKKEAITLPFIFVGFLFGCIFNYLAKLFSASI